MIFHLYCGVNSMDSHNSTLSAPNNINTPAMPHLIDSNNSTGMADTVHLGEKPLSEVMDMCNASYQIPLSKWGILFLPVVLSIV